MAYWSVRDEGLHRLQDDACRKGPTIQNSHARNIGQASLINAETIGSAVAVFDYSKFDEDRVGSDTANQTFEELKKGNLKHVEDAMIGVTAINEADILV